MPVSMNPREIAAEEGGLTPGAVAGIGRIALGPDWVVCVPAITPMAAKP